MIALACKGQQVVAVETRAIDEDAAAHDVEQHVRAVVRGGHRVARVLHAVGACEPLVATLGETTEAVRLLRTAHQQGVSKAAWHDTAPLRALRGFSEFEALIRPQK